MSNKTQELIARLADAKVNLEQGILVCDMLTLFKDCKAELERLQKDCEWQPIETAPKTFIDYGYEGLRPSQIITYDIEWCNQPVSISFWDNDHWQVVERDDATTHYAPTHWKPLPKAPEGV